MKRQENKIVFNNFITFKGDFQRHHWYKKRTDFNSDKFQANTNDLNDQKNLVMNLILHVAIV